MEIERITREALALPAVERIKLAETILKSLSEREDAQALKAWMAEAKLRLSEIRSGAVQPVPSSEVFRAAHAKFE